MKALLVLNALVFSLVMLGRGAQPANVSKFEAVQVNGLLQAQDIFFGPEQTPTALPAGATNNFSPCDAVTPANCWPSFMHWHFIGDVSGTSTITGLAAVASDRWRLVMNLGATDLTFTHLDPRSAAGNQLYLPGGLPLVLPSGGSVMFHYEASSAEWFTVTDPSVMISTYGGNGNLWGGTGGTTFSGACGLGTGGNTSFGIAALNSATTACFNTAVGLAALSADASGTTSTAIGYGALQNATVPVDDTAVGYLAGNNLTTGSEDVVVGVESMTACTTCTQNTVLGMSAAQQLTTGTGNVAIGYHSSAGTTGSNNIGIGNAAGAGIGTSIVQIAIGPSTMAALQSGAQGDIAIGGTAGTALTTGNNNTFVGLFSGAATTTTSENVAIGDHALNGNGNNNTAVGALALQVSTTGFANVCVGYSAGSTITTGAANTVLGYNNTLGITTGNFNTIVGGNIAGLAAGLSNNIILADGQGNIREQCDATGACSFAGTVATQSGSNIVLRCTVAGTLPIGALTIVAADCGASADTGLRVN